MAAIDLSSVIAKRKLHFEERHYPKTLKTSGMLTYPPTREELIILGMQERITEMITYADAFIFLPGDLATLKAKCSATKEEGYQS